MEAITNFSGNWLEIAAAVYLLGMVLYGHHKGFIRLAVSAAALAITILAVHIMLPHVTEWLRTATPVYESMQEKMKEAIGIDELLEKFSSKEQTQKEDEWMIIGELPIPEQFKQLLVENNNIEVYDQMKVELFQDYVIGYLTNTVMKAIVFLVLFFGVYLAIRFIVVWLDLIAKLPILSGLNQIAGAVLGAVIALFFIWVACFVFTAFSGTELGAAALNMISASSWLSWIYQHNILSMIVFGLVKSM